MKWFRTLLAVTLLGAAACSSTTAPRYPTPRDDDPEPQPPNTSLVSSDQGGVRWA